MPVVVSSALETSIGLAAGVALAAALPELPFDCGLNTLDLLDADVTSDAVRAESGVIPVHRPEAEDDLLVASAADPDTTAWWKERLQDTARRIHG